MKANLTLLLLCLFLLLAACREDIMIEPAGITAGQTIGKGIVYVDLNPDIGIFLPNLWIKQDTTITIDIDQDSIDDCTFRMTGSYPGMMGSGGGSLTLIPLAGTGLCTVPSAWSDTLLQSPCTTTKLDWVDTLSMADSVWASCRWTAGEAMLYRSAWIMSYCSLDEGFWPSVTGTNQWFIGFRLPKEKRSYFGWIGLYRNAGVYKITGYAYAMEYRE